VNTRTRKSLGVAAAAAALTASVTLANSAYADPALIPDPQGPGCDAFKASVPNFKQLSDQPVGTVLASIPDISTFNSAISGQLNPAVNVVGVLNNGPYVVFAPNNAAFAKLPPDQLEALKTDTRALFDLDYYHVFLGLLGPDDVKGTRPTQQGAEMTVTGKGGDITVDNVAKVVCGDIHASNAVIYIIDTVLPVPGPSPLAAEAPATTPGAAEGTPAPTEGTPATPGTAEATPATPAPAEATPSTPTSEATPASPAPASPTPTPTPTQGPSA